MRVEIRSICGEFDTASQSRIAVSALMSAVEDEGEVSPPPPAPPVLQQQADRINEWHSGVDRCQVVRLPDHQWERQSTLSPRIHPPPSVSTESSALPPASPAQSHPIAGNGGSEIQRPSSPPVSPEQNERWACVPW